MASVQPVGFRASGLTVRAARRVGLALMASLGFVLPPVPDPRGARLPGSAHQQVMLAALPCTTADITAAPVSTLPDAATAGFTVHSRPILAAIVSARRLRNWARTRIGGLYGP